MKPFCSLLTRSAAGWVLLIALLSSLARPVAAQTFDLITLTSQVWRFDDSATDLGTAWKEVNYPAEAGWRTGTALFGVEPTVPYPYPVAMSTPLVLGARRITYYFRTQFNLANPPATLLVQGTAYVDDGAVFYVNGQEVGRVRMPAPLVAYTNKAQLSYPEGLPYTWTIPSSALVTGNNVLAVEVHQNDANSSDVVFGLGLRATVAVPPSLLNPNEPTDRVVMQGQSTTLSVMGDGIPAPTYQWYHNAMAVPGANGSVLQLNNVMAADGGPYYVVLSNSAGTLTSRVAQVTFLADTNPPSILYAIERNLSTVEVYFSEALEPFAATDVVNWSLATAQGAAPQNVVSILIRNGTNLVFTTESPLDPGTSYALTSTELIGDLFANYMPTGTRVLVASFPTQLFAHTNKVWSYDASGTDLGSGWAAVGFNDAGWATGPGVFDVFRAQSDFPAPHCQRQLMMLPGTGELVGTCLQTLSNAQNTAQYSAAYFRTHFNFTGNVTNSVLRLRALVDDGAVFYLNGVELIRPGMAAGPVSYGTLASRNVPNPAWETFELATAALLPGDNVIAVEVHQESLTSPDLTFALELTGILPAPAP